MCGILGIYSLQTGENINLHKILLCLKEIQHRGKDSHGVSFIRDNNSAIQFHKKKGLVDENVNDIDNIKCAIGHVRYGTSSTKNYSLKEAQPLISQNKENTSFISLVHNGNIPNIKIHDSRYLLDYIAKNLEISGGNVLSTLAKLMNDIPASYSLLLMFGNKIYVVRDRFGIRPLYYCITNNSAMVCSETLSFPKNSTINEVNPGEILELSETGISHLYQYPNSQNSLCAFELFYFMSPDNIYKNTRIFELRKKLGKLLASQEENYIVQNDTIVVGVPTSGIAYGKGFAAELYLPYQQVIKQNNSQFGAGRTFILKNNEERNHACREKFTYDEEKISGKNVIVVDDTLVRGNVIKNIISRLKNCGAREIHIRIPSPPVVDICQLGIDIKTREELLMYNYSLKEATAHLKVHSLRFLTLNDLDGFPEECYAHCFGKPLPDGIKNYVDKTQEEYANISR